MNKNKIRDGKNSPGFVQTFSQIAPTYDRKYGAKLSQSHNECLTRVREAFLISAPQCILDIGCGTGALLELLHREWPQAQLFGVDPAEGMLNEGRIKRQFATYIKAEAECLPFKSASFDLVVSSMSFGHWHNKIEGLRQVSRLLKPTGMFLLIENAPAGWGLTSVLNWLLGSLADYRSQQEIAELASQANLRSTSLEAIDRKVIVAVFRPNTESEVLCTTNS